MRSTEVRQGQHRSGKVSRGQMRSGEVSRRHARSVKVSQGQVKQKCVGTVRLTTLSVEIRALCRN